MKLEAVLVVLIIILAVALRAKAVALGVKVARHKKQAAKSHRVSLYSVADHHTILVKGQQRLDAALAADTNKLAPTVQAAEATAAVAAAVKAELMRPEAEMDWARVRAACAAAERTFANGIEAATTAINLSTPEREAVAEALRRQCKNVRDLSAELARE